MKQVAARLAKPFREYRETVRSAREFNRAMGGFNAEFLVLKREAGEARNAVTSTLLRDAYEKMDALRFGEAVRAKNDILLGEHVGTLLQKAGEIKELAENTGYRDEQAFNIEGRLEEGLAGWLNRVDQGVFFSVAFASCLVGLFSSVFYFSDSVVLNVLGAVPLATAALSGFGAYLGGKIKKLKEEFDSVAINGFGKIVDINQSKDAVGVLECIFQRFEMQSVREAVERAGKFRVESIFNGIRSGEIEDASFVEIK